MSGCKRHLLVAAFLLWPSTAPRAQDREPLSPRNANYTIEVRLDVAEKSLEGKEIVEWRNDMDLPARELWFHLYWNAWKNNQSTWMREAAGGRREKRRVGEGDWAYCSVKSMRVLAGGAIREADISGQLRFAAPDDNNPSDQTVLVAALPQAVGPGETIRVEVVWRSKIPRTFSRTGFRGDYYFIAQWFPKLGVYQVDGSWNCHQFHAGTEFFSDYGVYDVGITVPKDWLLGATGLAESLADNRDGTTTHRYRQADVHDFAWTTSPDYREARRVFAAAGIKPVDMRLLYQPEHRDQVERHFKATEAALLYYGTWYGEYPYGHITIIDPAWQSGSGGMEYPTIFTCGTRILNPAGCGSPEVVTVHEAGHQFWYGIVGNNEFEHAWIDEGLNTFSTARAVEAAFGEQCYVDRFLRGFVPVPVRDIKVHRMTAANRLHSYREAARSDVQATPSYLYHPATASRITYDKTALWLGTLERMIGWETLQKILSTFFQRWKFRHPGPADFFAVANEVSGRDLAYFFNEVYRKPAVFDYAVQSVASERVGTEGFIDRDGRPTYVKKDEDGLRLYESRVVLRRLQDGIFPVDVLMKFENGEEHREVWDGRDLWKQYALVKPARLSHAVVDPERKILLDINYSNNSRLLTPRAGFAASKWASKWMIWLQDYLQTLSFLL